MPTTAVGFLLTIVFALPGYVYHRISLRRRPERVDTAVQELLSIVFVGVAIDFGTVALLALGAGVLPLRTPNLSRLIVDPGGYSAAHLSLVAGWGVAFLVTTIGLAVLLALEPWARFLPVTWRRWRSDRARRVGEQQSSWWLLFHEHPNATIHVGCALDDGSYVSGRLHNYSKAANENGDRELALSGEIFYRPPDDPKGGVLPAVNAVSISARRLVLLTVTYVMPDQTPPQPPVTEPPAVVA